jgi:PAS domain S-box-containing protein
MNGELKPVLKTSLAPPVVYVARKAADKTVATTRLAGSASSWENGEAALPVIERQILLAGHALAKHWAFGGSDDHEQEGLVVMPDQDSACVIEAFRVNIQRHETEADSAVIVVRREDATLSPNATPVELATNSASPFWQDQEAAGGLWSLAGCCRYVYQINERDELTILRMEGPFSLYYGIDAEEMASPTFALFLRNILPEDRPFPNAIRKILIANGTWSGAYRVRGKDGCVRHMKHFAVLHTHEGSAYVSGLILDQSAVVDAQAESAAFRHTFENSREGFAITDTSGRYTYANQEYARLFGYRNSGELLGRKWKLLYREAETELIQKAIFPVMRKAGFWRGHVLALKRDGATFQQDLTLSLLEGGGILCICRDRTDELVINARLEESETMLRTLFDALPMGIVIRDEHGARKFANGFMLRGNGLDVEGASGADWAEKDPEWKLRQAETDRQVLATGQSSEYVIESPVAGTMHWFHCIVFLVPASSGGGRRVGSLVMDITRQKQLEQEAHTLSERRRGYLEMQREFISMVSHEFRTPLTAIQGAQYLLEKLLKESGSLSGPVAEKTERWLSLQASGLGTLKKLVDQVLVLNRIQHMTGETSLAVLSPAEVLTETVARFNDSMDIPRVILRNDMPPGFVASMDPGLVKAAAENLISNGLKYSGLELAVKVRVYPEPEGWAVDVVDLGRGIPKADQVNLFHPFFRAGNVGTVPGTGLGLAIVQRAVDFHGGKVEFESGENMGTSFKLHFPSVVRPPPEDSIPARNLPL